MPKCQGVGAVRGPVDQQPGLLVPKPGRDNNPGQVSTMAARYRGGSDTANSSRGEDAFCLIFV